MPSDSSTRYTLSNLQCPTRQMKRKERINPMSPAFPRGESLFFSKSCPWGEHRGRGDFVKKSRTPGKKVPGAFSRKNVFPTPPPQTRVYHTFARCIPRAQQRAMLGLNSVYEKSSKKARTDNCWGCLHLSNSLICIEVAVGRNRTSQMYWRRPPWVVTSFYLCSPRG